VIWLSTAASFALFGSGCHDGLWRKDLERMVVCVATGGRLFAAGSGVDGAAGERRRLYKGSRFLALFSLHVCVVACTLSFSYVCCLFRAIAARLHADLKNKYINT
jgi:hypothetical protein